MVFTLPQNSKRSSFKLEHKDRGQVVVTHSCNPSTMKAEIDCHVGDLPKLHSLNYIVYMKQKKARRAHSPVIERFSSMLTALGYP